MFGSRCVCHIDLKEQARMMVVPEISQCGGYVFDINMVVQAKSIQAFFKTSQWPTKSLPRPT